MNFYEVGDLLALPKHIWQGKDFNKINFDFPVTSGPYKIKELKKNRYLLMELSENWWGRSKAYNQHKYNFQNLKFKFMADRNKALKTFVKGEFDVYHVGSATNWIKKTDIPAVKKGWVIKQKVYNQEPRSFRGFVINLRREKFNDIKTRKALAYLLNREKINEKLMYNQYSMLNTYYPDLHSEQKNPKTEMFKFNSDKARSLLKEAGWVVNDKGQQEKQGKSFGITFITTSEDLRHINVYVEDLKQVGIIAKIEKLSWSSLSKRMDNHEFDMYWAGWGATRLRDPEAMWHSKTANQIATNNMAGVQDDLIDSLIEIQKTIMDIEKRNSILKQIDTRLGEIIPYVLLWGLDYHRILYWNKFGTPEYVLGKFLDPLESVIPYWWKDSEKEKTLETAKTSDQKLPLLPAEIHYRE